MNNINYKTNNAILTLLLEQQEIEEVKQDIGLVSNGDGYETHSGKFFTTDDVITLRDKATIGLGSTKFTGIVAKKYDGLNDGQLVFNADGYARVGDEGSLQMIATREDAPITNGIAFYDNSTRKFKTKAESSLSVGNADNAYKLGGVVATNYARTDIDEIFNGKVWLGGQITSSNASLQVNGFMRTGNIYIHSGGGVPDNDRSNDYLTNISGELKWYKGGSPNTIWHSGNSNLSTVDWNANTLTASAGAFANTVSLPSFGGNFSFIKGSADAANYNGQNTVLSIWNGLGFYNPTKGGIFPNQTSGYVDVRNGFLDMKGGFKVNGNTVYHSGNSNKSTVDWNAKNVNATGVITTGNTTSYKTSMSVNSFNMYPTTTVTGYFDVYRPTTGDGAIQFRNAYANSNHTGMLYLSRTYQVMYSTGSERFRVDNSGTKTIGNSEAYTFRNTVTNTDYNHIVRTGTGSALYVQNGSTAGAFNIATFSKGSTVAGVGTIVLNINSDGIDVTGVASVTGDINTTGLTYLKRDSDEQLRLRPNATTERNPYISFYRCSVSPRSGYIQAANSNMLMSSETGYIRLRGLLGTRIEDSAGILRLLTTSDGTTLTGINKFEGTAESYLTYISGITGQGWRITNEADGELSNLDIREGLTCNTFTNNKINISNGDLIVSDSDVVEDISPNLMYFTTEQPFQIGDVLRCQGSKQAGNIKSYYVTVTGIGTSSSVKDEDGNYKAYVQYGSKTGTGVVETGDVVVRWNSSTASRKGLLYLSSSSSYAPFYDVVYDGVTKSRFGNLAGISGQSGYGIWGSSNGTDTNFVISSSGYAKIAGWNFDKDKIYSGATELRTGSNAGLIVRKAVNDSSNWVRMNYNSITNWGIQGASGGYTIFELGSTNQIAGWTFTHNRIIKGSWTSGAVDINSAGTVIQAGHSGQDRTVLFGKLSDGSFGVEGKKFNSTESFFKLSSNGNRIAGWDFTSSSFSSTNNGFKTLMVNALGSNTPRFEVYKDDGNYTRMYHSTTNVNDWGIVGRKDNANVFQLGAVNQIAGWNFSSTEFNSGSIYLNSAGGYIANWTSAGGLKWKLAGDGSGILANNNISWDSSGNVTFSPNVKMAWNSITGTADISNRYENGIVTIPRPVGGTYSGVSGDTGAIKITLPQSWTSTMLSFTIDIYNYSTGTSQTVKVGGYNYSSSTYWVNPSAVTSSGSTGDLRVRFGHDGSKCCIYLGEANTVWQYPKVAIRDFQGGHLNYAISQWNDGWVVSTETSIASNIDADFTSTLATAGDTTSVNSAKVGGSTLITNNKIRTSLLNATEVQASVVTSAFIKTLNLEVGNQILMGNNAVIKWSQITDTTALTNTIATAQNTANSSVNALGGSSFPKLTKITSTGVYTGTLTAGQITAGTINANRIDTDSLKAALITATNINTLTLTTTKGTIGGWNIGTDGINKISGSYCTKSGIELVGNNNPSLNFYRNGTSTTSNSTIKFHNGTTLGATIQSINTASTYLRGLEIISTGSLKLESPYLINLVSNKTVNIDAEVVNFNDAVITRKGGSFGGGVVVHGYTMTSDSLEYYQLNGSVKHIYNDINSPAELSDNYDSFFFNATGGKRIYIKMPNPFNYADGSRILLGTRGKDVTIVATTTQPLNWDDAGLETSNNYSIDEECRWVEWAMFDNTWYLVRTQNL